MFLNRLELRIGKFILQWEYFPFNTNKTRKKKESKVSLTEFFSCDLFSADWCVAIWSTNVLLFTMCLVFGWRWFDCVSNFAYLFFSNDDLNWPLNQFRIKWLWLIIYFFFCFFSSSVRWMFESYVLFEFDLCSAHMCSICNNIQFWWNGFAGKRIVCFSLFRFNFRASKILLAVS